MKSEPLGKRFVDAVSWATELHTQSRKGTDIPYLSHLLAVASLVLEDSGDETVAIAAVLHDAVEDTSTTRDDIAARFGDDVATVVDACTETQETPKPDWSLRKPAYLERLAHGDIPPAALLIAAADKLHNVRSIITDVRLSGDTVWDRFDAPDRSATVRFYQGAYKALAGRIPESRSVTELARAVAELETLAAASGASPT